MSHSLVNLLISFAISCYGSVNKQMDLDLAYKGNLEFASAVKDAAKAEIIVKLVNTSGQAQTVPLQIKGVKAGREVQVFTMAGNDPEAVNSFDQPRNISPVAGSAEVNNNRLDLQIPAQGFQVYRIRIE